MRAACCALEGDEDKCCKDLGCTAAAYTTAWFLVIITDVVQTYNLFHWEGDERISKNLAIASLVVLIWGASLLLSSTMLLIFIHQKKFKEDWKFFADALIIADFVVDEIPNLVLVIMFWSWGGLRGDTFAAVMSIVQAILAALTAFFHMMRACSDSLASCTLGDLDGIDYMHNILLVLGAPLWPFMICYLRLSHDGMVKCI